MAITWEKIQAEAEFQLTTFMTCLVVRGGGWWLTRGPVYCWLHKTINFLAEHGVEDVKRFTLSISAGPRGQGTQD